MIQQGMIRIEMLIARLPGLGEAEIVRWVERGWVRPEGPPGGWQFQEIDVARCRLILELKRDMDVQEEAVPVVLGLLDQVYDLRQTLRGVLQELGRQPEGVRQAVLARVARRPPEIE